MPTLADYRKQCTDMADKLEPIILAGADELALAMCTAHLLTQKNAEEKDGELMKSIAKQANEHWLVAVGLYVRLIGVAEVVKTGDNIWFKASSGSNENMWEEIKEYSPAVAERLKQVGEATDQTVADPQG